VDEFDGVGIYDVLEHVEDDRGVLDSIGRALHQDGFVIITVPQHPALWSAVDVQAHHVRRYTWRGLEALLHEVGFTVEYATSFVTALLPVMWLSRMSKRDCLKEVDPLDELRLPAWLNRLFGGALSVEARLLAAGFRFPIGGSLLILARRTK
jgi:SAM-dependent methyltransferase